MVTIQKYTISTWTKRRKKSETWNFGRWG